jgi:hypothetical protein
MKALRRKVRKGTSVNRAVRMFNSKTGGRLHPSTLARRFKESKDPLKYSKITAKQALKKDTQKARLKFCKKYEKRKHHHWVFVDGTVITLRTGVNSKVNFRWTRVDEEVPKEKGKLIAYFFVYAAVARGWKSKLYFVRPSWTPGCTTPKSVEPFTSKDYMTTMHAFKAEMALEGKLDGFQIVRDHAPQHMSKVSQAEMVAADIPILVDFPARSFDLNMIEPVWAHLKRGVDLRRASTPEGFKRVIKEVWEKLPQATIDGLIRGGKTNMQKVIAKKGKWCTSYPEAMDC